MKGVGNTCCFFYVLDVNVYGVDVDGVVLHTLS